jgi:hypothetical protein
MRDKIINLAWPVLHIEGRIYSMNPIRLIKHKDFGGGIGLFGFVQSDSIIWFVGGGENPAVPENELRIWDNRNDKQLCKIMLKANIISTSI